MRYGRITTYFLAIIVIGFAGYFTTREFYWPTIPKPIFRPITPVDLGVQEAGQVAIGEIELTNDGDADLIIGGVRTSCSCTGLETKEIDGKLRPIGKLTIPPHSKVTTYVRLAVSGPANGSIASTIHFLTNDPQNREVTVRVTVSRITLGLRTLPETIAFGDVSIGEKAFKDIDIIDHRGDFTPIEKVTSSQPDLFHVEMVPFNVAKVKSGGNLVGRIRVTLHTTLAKNIDAQVNAWFSSDSGRSIAVRVTGRVVPTFEVVPSTITLPLHSVSGNVYRARVICYAQKLEKIRIADCPKGYTAKLPDDNTSPSKIVLIEQSSTDTVARRATITLAATVNGVETLHPITVVSKP